MNLLAFLTFPYSLIFLTFAFAAGVGITSMFIGLLTFFICVFLIWLDVIRITPLITFIMNIIEFIWPEKIKTVQNSISNSFILEYPDGKPKMVPQIFLFHPHGAFTSAYFLNIGTRMTKWHNRPIKGAALSLLSYFPFGKEFFDRLNLVPSNYDDMKNVLEDNESLGVCLGGLRESLYTDTGKMRLSILKKRGVFRMALEKGCALVPVLTYGENELHQIIDSGWLKWLNANLIKSNILILIPTFESCKRWIGMLEKPLAEPLRTVVGSAIPVASRATPTDAEISELREKYFVALRDLYSRTKPSHYADELEIV